MKKAEKLYMSKPISTSSLKTQILLSKNPKYYIELLLRTLPYSIKEEFKRNNPSMDVLRNLTNKYTMVQKLAKEII